MPDFTGRGLISWLLSFVIGFVVVSWFDWQLVYAGIDDWLFPWSLWTLEYSFNRLFWQFKSFLFQSFQVLSQVSLMRISIVFSYLCMLWVDLNSIHDVIYNRVRLFIRKLQEEWLDAPNREEILKERCEKVGWNKCEDNWNQDWRERDRTSTAHSVEIDLKGQECREVNNHSQ